MNGDGCKTEELLGAYLAGDVTDTERLAIETLLAESICAREERDELRRVCSRLKLGNVSASAELLSKSSQWNVRFLAKKHAEELLGAALTGDVSASERRAVDAQLAENPSAYDLNVELTLAARHANAAQLTASTDALNRLRESLAAQLPRAGLAPVAPAAVSQRITPSMRIYLRQENQFKKQLWIAAAAAMLLVAAGLALWKWGGKSSDPGLAHGPSTPAPSNSAPQPVDPNVVPAPNQTPQVVQGPSDVHLPPAPPPENVPVVPPEKVVHGDGLRNAPGSVAPKTVQADTTGTPVTPPAPPSQTLPSAPTQNGALAQQGNSPTQTNITPAPTIILPTSANLDPTAPSVVSGGTPGTNPTPPNPASPVAPPRPPSDPLAGPGGIPEVATGPIVNPPAVPSGGGGGSLPPVKSPGPVSPSVPSPFVPASNKIPAVDNVAIVGASQGVSVAAYTAAGVAERAKPYDQLVNGSQITTGAGSMVGLVLPRDGRLYVSQNTSLTVNFSGANTTIALSSGEIYYVAPGGGKLALTTGGCALDNIHEADVAISGLQLNVANFASMACDFVTKVAHGKAPANGLGVSALDGSGQVLNLAMPATPPGAWRIAVFCPGDALKQARNKRR